MEQCSLSHLIFIRQPPYAKKKVSICPWAPIRLIAGVALTGGIIICMFIVNYFLQRVCTNFSTGGGYGQVLLKKTHGKKILVIINRERSFSWLIGKSRIFIKNLQKSILLQLTNILEWLVYPKVGGRGGKEETFSFSLFGVLWVTIPGPQRCGDVTS